MTPRIAEIPYHADGAELYERLRDRPWSVFLDSGPPEARRGRFDIIAAEPEVRVVTRAGRTTVGGVAADRVAGDPLEALRQALGPRTRSVDPWPFAGGAIGCFGYELGRLWEPVARGGAPCDDAPDLAAGIHGWAVVVDHALRRAALISDARSALTAAGTEALLETLHGGAGSAPPRPFVVRGPLRVNMSRDEHAAALSRIARYIRDGDVYQINFSQRFDAEVDGDPWEFYRRLRRRNPAPYSAYLSFPFATILSASPEQFLQVRGGRVTTRPIKGTRARDPDPARDRALARELQASAKDRAENLMIVDLLRNDLGKTCAIGSVTVPHLFEIESYASVHHLVSTVEGELAPDRDALDLLRGCFPGGSITGAPKRRAMEIIEELEPNRRGVHYGAIGYLGFDGSMDLNIAIRTLIVSGGTVRFWAGGGIVADSDAQAEYQECLDKVAPMLELLGATPAMDADRRGAV
jgi:para-aminobenzoate synthetase component 1